MAKKNNNKNNKNKYKILSLCKWTFEDFVRPPERTKTLFLGLRKLK